MTDEYLVWEVVAWTTEKHAFSGKPAWTATNALSNQTIRDYSPVRLCYKGFGNGVRQNSNLPAPESLLCREIKGRVAYIRVQ